jgi:hypothetical protein
MTETKPNHAALPTLCPHCLDSLKRVAQSTVDGIAATWCPHRATVARATVVDGALVHVVLDGPVDPAAARAQMAALDAELRGTAESTVLHRHQRAH